MFHDLAARLLVPHPFLPQRRLMQREMKRVQDLFLETYGHVPRLGPIPRLAELSNNDRRVQPGLLLEFTQDCIIGGLTFVDASTRDLRAGIDTELIEDQQTPGRVRDVRDAALVTIRMPARHANQTSTHADGIPRVRSHSFSMDADCAQPPL